jgi:hypothetical protein
MGDDPARRPHLPGGLEGPVVGHAEPGEVISTPGGRSSPAAVTSKTTLNAIVTVDGGTPNPAGTRVP